MDFNKEELQSLLKSPTVTDKNLERVLRETTRGQIANKLIWLLGILYTLFLTAGALLIYHGKIEFRDLLELILALGMLAGFLGTAIQFYFKDT